MNKDDRFVNPTIETMDEISDHMSEFFRVAKKIVPGHEIFEEDDLERIFAHEMIENKIDILEGDIDE